MATIINKYRAVLSIYDQDNLPETKAFKGIVYDTIEEARAGIEKIAQEMMKDLLSAKTFNRGYDPMGYFLERYNDVCIFIHHNKLVFDEHLGCPAKSFMYNVHIQPIMMQFCGNVNKISYRSMELEQFTDNWYWYVKACNGTVIGSIPACNSLNTILAHADKIYDELDPNHTVSAPQLENN